MMMSRRYVIATNALDYVEPKMFVALGSELANRGNSVILLIDRQKFHLEDHTANPATYVWPSPRPAKLRDARYLLRLIRTWHPDCLITEGKSSEWMVLALGRLAGVPLRITFGYRTLQRAVQIIFGLSDWQLNRYTLKRRILYWLSAPHAFGASQPCCDELVDLMGVPAENVHWQPWLLPDPLATSDLPATSEQNRLVCVGRLDYGKGQDVLIRALALLKPDFPDLHVEFIGEGVTKDNLLQLAEELGVTRSCSFLGHLDREEVFARMASAIISVLPSRNEAFGIVTVESFSVGTPVVAARTGGLSEVIRDGLDGLFFTSEDHHDLAAKIRHLLEDADFRERLGCQARERFLDDYEITRNVSKLATRFEQLVEEAAGQRQRR